MENKQLTEEEANELFQKTFLQISKQNSAERQKLVTNSLEHQKDIFDVSSKSPNKSAFRPTFYSNPQILQNHFEISHDYSPLKISRHTSVKISMDKSQSLKEFHDFSLDNEIKSIEKEENLPEKNHKILLISPQQKILSDDLDQKIQEELPQINLGIQKNLYLESSIKQVKRDLQIKSKGKICKSQDINPKTGQLISYNFVCKNSNECPFDCSLQYSGQRTSNNQKLYKLVIRCQSHLKSCIQQQQQLLFMKLTKRVDQMQSDIIHLLEQKSYLKPKQILSIMAQTIGQNNHKFIYNGLTNKSYHKAAKKYFDNLIYKIKNQMGIL